MFENTNRPTSRQYQCFAGKDLTAFKASKGNMGASDGDVVGRSHNVIVCQARAIHFNARIHKPP